MIIPHFLQDVVNWLNELATLNPNEPFKTSGKVASMIGVGVAVATTLATKTYPWLKAKADRRSLQKRTGAELFPAASIERSIRYYITPYCQNVDPATGDEPGAIYSVKQDLFKALDDALSHPIEYKYLILLADSGMGKTSALINYYVRHLRRWRRKFEINLVPLNIPDADERIAAIPNKGSTVLFLDALDEDMLAIVDHVERIRLLLKLTREFGRVVMTCRTQFFPRDEEIPKETGILKIGDRLAGEKAEYIFHKLYLTPFTNSQVHKYLRRKYPLWRYLRRRKAKQMAQKIPSLTARPMLLAHIDDLVESNLKINYSFELYEEMIEAWLKREEGFITQKEDLRQFCQLLAVDLYSKRQARGAERIPRAQLTSLAKDWNIPLDDWKLGGRSLLNRDAHGNYKFAHRSIMEYLFVNSFIQGYVENVPPELTDQMNLFLSEIVMADMTNTTRKVLLDIQRSNLRTEHIAVLIKALASSKLNKTSSNNDHKAWIEALLVLMRSVVRNIGKVTTKQFALFKVTGTEHHELILELLVGPPEWESKKMTLNFTASQASGSSREIFRSLAKSSFLIKSSEGKVKGLLAFVSPDGTINFSPLLYGDVTLTMPYLEMLLPMLAELIDALEGDLIANFSNY
jgi:hypothetical protein